jgi:periplasmic protein CpxP/Spy
MNWAAHRRPRKETNMKVTNVLAGMAGLVLAAFPATGLAQMRPGGEFGGGMPGIKILLKAAQLTPDQRNQVHDIMRTTHQSVKPIQEQIRQLHEQLADKLAGSGAVQLSDLTPVQQQIDGLHSQIEQLRLKAALQVRALLTPDQLARVASKHQQMKALHEQMREVMGAPDGETEGPEHEGPPPPME